MDRSRVIELLKELQAWLWPLEFIIVVVAFFLGVNAFTEEREARRQEREARAEQRLVETWQMLKEVSPSAVGKVLEALGERGEELTFTDLSRARHGGPAYLPGLDMFDEGANKGVDFRMSNFAGAVLREADFSRSDLFGSCLYGVEFGKAKLVGTNFTQANLTKANLWDADLTEAVLADANLSGTHLDKSKGITQAQLDAAFYCDEKGGPPNLPNGLSAPPKKTGSACTHVYSQVMGFECESFERR